ncbi:MAG: HAMP domain-containing sensor histidine kinase [Pseudomonadota bacterium]|nr:HAMP domain-containing sensor histidine kinase [Pseudomonadota bacterium]
MSCLALTFFYDYLESHGLSRRVLQEGLPYTPSWLDDRLNWIDFETFLVIEGRVAPLFPGVPELFYDIGLTFATTKGFGFLRVVIHGLFSPYQMYKRFPTLVERFLFPFVKIGVEQSGPDTLRAHYRFSPEVTPSDAFLDTVRGILAGVPPMVGAPLARVSMTRLGPQEAVFDIAITKWITIGQRVRSLWERVATGPRKRLQNLSDAATELEEANRLLQEKVAALTDAKRQLDRKVRDLTVLNALARAATSELDARSMLRRAAVTISDGLGHVPVAILLVDGEPGGFVVAAWRGIPLAELTELGALAQADAPGAVRMSRAPTRLRLAGRAWWANPLLSHERLVGAMLVGVDPQGVDEGDLDPALLESMASQLAISVENAQSYRVIADLRDTLEVRVRERTAELEEARTSLEDTVTRLEHADQAKDRFFTNVSHDFLTPLTLILAPLEDLEVELAAGRHGDVQATVRAARQNATALLHLVGELLDFAKFDAGALPIHRIELELCSLVQDVVDTLCPLADRKNIALSAELCDGAVSVLADPSLLRRVLVNLVGNAIKYVRFGDRVVVRVRVLGTEAILEVEDNGPGIAPEDQAHIFERFTRGRGEGSVEGSGIGLAMARDLVRAHDGVVELDSEPGHGACFRVRLPRDGHAPRVELVRIEAPSPQRVAEAVGVDQDAPSLLVLEGGAETQVRSRTQVLVVEDNPEMRAFLLRILSRDHHVRAVGDAREAQAIVARDMPDVVVSDVMMAHVDGLELCRRLKNNVATRGIPVLLLSARHGSDAVLQAFSVGADDYITKPFSPPELLARVNAQIRIRLLATTLLRMEKQYSLGVLSAGIAHEMLNPVNAVINAVSPLRRALQRLGANPEGRDFRQADALIEAIEVSGRRMHSVVKGMLAYTRQEHTPRVQSGRLSEEIEAVLTILQYRTVEFTIHRHYDWDEPVEHFPEWIDQVVMNLVSNALDAMGTRGDLWIHTERVGDAVCIRVRDTGPGVPPELRERIFTPFFTTKPPGKGTGLGLAVAREIVAMHLGKLELDPTVRIGAEFVVTLPLERPPLILEA